MGAFSLRLGIFLALAGCKTTTPSSLLDLTEEQQREIMSFAYDGIFRGTDHPRDTLPLDHRKLKALGPHCGMGDSELNLFQTNSPGLRGFFVETVWRRFPIPPLQGGNDPRCGEGEELSDGHCWRSFGLQFYPSDVSPETSIRIVGNTSPLIRLIPKENYPSEQQECSFKGRKILIWVAGIRNPGIGNSWRNTDKELLAALMAWNSRSTWPLLPGGNSKLREFPAYIQLVNNDGALISGILGKHDESAIRRLANNLKLAYGAGAEAIELISHSNGSITTHMGLQLFLDEIASPGGTVLRNQREQLVPNIKMAINIFHMQGAPSQKWSLNALNSFDSYSDFLRNAVWVRKTSALGVPYWGWNWDFSVHDRAKQFTDLKLRFFYNRPDYLTYPIFNLVGRSKSLAWQKEVNNNGMAHGVDTAIEHFKCTDSSVAQCGPGHKQREVLWSFADPSQAISWESELKTPPVEIEGRSIAMAAFIPETQDLELEPKQMPEVVCVSTTAHPDYCRQAFAETAATNGPEIAPTSGPLFLCADTDQEDHPCNQINLSDGMCSLKERRGREFNRECYFPKNLRFCECTGEQCNATGITCRNDLCDVKTTPVDNCTCPVGGGEIACEPGASYCRLEYGRQGGNCIRIQSIARDPGSSMTEVCQGEECLANARDLGRESAALPQAANGAAGFDSLPVRSTVEER